MKRRASLKVVIPVVLVLVLAVALPLTSSCTRAPAPAEAEPIKVGMPIPLTGSEVAEGQEFYCGGTLMLEEINEAGGLLGRPIEVLTADVGTYTAEQITQARNYLINEGVDVFLPGYIADPASYYVFGESDIPFIHTYCNRTTEEIYAAEPDKYGNCIQVVANETYYGPNNFNALCNSIPIDLGYEYPNNKIAIQTMQTDYGQIISEEFRKAAIAGGWEVVYDEEHPWGQAEWGVQLAQIRELEPAIIFFSTFSVPESASFAQQFLDNPTDALLYIQYCPSVPEFRDLLKEGANGIFWSTMISYIPGPKGDGFAERFEEMFDRPPGGSTAAICYDMAGMWAKAAEAVGNAKDYQAISDYIVENPYDGVCGKYVINPATHSALTGDDTIPWQFVQIQNQKDVLIYLGTQSTGAQIITPPWIGQ